MRKHSGAIERHHAGDALCGAAETYRRVWASACRHDKIDPKAKFVAFSKDNPYARFVDYAAAQLTNIRREYAAGGYIGLQIEKGK